MINIDPGIPLLAAVCWAIAAVAVTVVTYIRLRPVTRPAYLLWLVLCRLGAITLILVLLLQPYVRTTVPDRAAFRIAVLADASGSMQTRDCTNDRSRLDVLRALLAGDNADAFASRLAERYDVETHLFAGDRRRFHGGDFDVLPGRTALGGALEKTLDDRANLPLGGVVVLSDGHGNTPPDAAEAAKQFRRADIPVSTIGIGEEQGEGDISITAPPKTVRTTRGKPAALEANVQNTTANDVRATVQLRTGDTLLESRSVSVPADGTNKTVNFRVTPLQAGHHTYRMQLVPETEDPRPETNVDYAAVDVKEPDTFRVLYLSANLHWEYTFLKRLSDTTDQLDLSAVIRTGDDKFHYLMPDDLDADKRPEGFPRQREFFNRHNVVIVDVSAEAALTQQGREALAAFAEDRGGGLLFVGPASEVSTRLQAVLPVSATTTDRPVTRRYLATDEIIFPESRAASLNNPPGAYLPERLPAYLAEALKRGARSHIRLKNEELALLSAQYYGSGRIAHLGTESTWRWHLASESDQGRHEAFWTNLLVWLASTGKPRLRTPLEGKRYPLHESVPLSVRLLRNDYQPALAAQVSVLLSGPEERVRETELAPSPARPGQYEAAFTPAVPGEYRASIRAELPDGTRMTHEAFFLAVHGGAEMKDTAYREGTLRDIARVTGGTFVSYRDAPNVSSIPVSKEVAGRETLRYWSESWLFLTLLLGVLALEWYLRRRIGLR